MRDFITAKYRMYLDLLKSEKDKIEKSEKSKLYHLNFTVIFYFLFLNLNQIVKKLKKLKYFNIMFLDFSTRKKHNLSLISHCHWVYSSASDTNSDNIFRKFIRLYQRQITKKSWQLNFNARVFSSQSHSATGWSVNLRH